MDKKEHTPKATLIPCVLLVLAAIFINDSVAQVSRIEVDITNLAPVVNASTIQCNEPVSLTEAMSGANMTFRLWCNATVHDINGYQDIYKVWARLWYNNTANETDADDYANHYTNIQCNLSSGSGTSVKAHCWFDVQYFADPGEWTFKFNATDNGNLWSTGNTTQITVEPHLALVTPNIINFGSMLPGQTSSASKTATLNNTCNQEIDIQVNAQTNVLCNAGMIPLSNIHYDVEDAAFDDMCGALSTNIADTCQELRLSFNLGKTTTKTGTPASSVKNTYWRIRISEGVSGSCNGTLMFKAIASE